MTQTHGSHGTHCLTKVMENNLTKLDSFFSMPIVEVELNFRRVSVDLRECNRVPEFQPKLQLSETNFMPAALKQIPREDFYFRWGHSWVIAGALKADAFEGKFLREIDFNPGSVVVRSFPLVPLLHTWT